MTGAVSPTYTNPRVDSPLKAPFPGFTAHHWAAVALRHRYAYTALMALLLRLAKWVGLFLAFGGILVLALVSRTIGLPD